MQRKYFENLTSLHICAFALNILLFLILSFMTTGCTKVPPSDDCCVRSTIAERIEKDIYWNTDGFEGDQVTNYVESLLSMELTIDSAVQIALLNNPEIHAEFEEIGIAHADLVNAGLFQNPVFDAFFRFPDRSSLSLNTEFSVTQTFLDILLVPLRQKIAASEFEKTKFRVANAVLNISFDVQETYYHLVAEQKKLSLLALFVEATEAANELALGQKQQGNINEIALQSKSNEFLQAKIEFYQSRMDLIRLKERMNRLLGLVLPGNCWEVSSDLPSIPHDELTLECLEGIALSQRLDLEAARWEVETIVRMGAVREWWAYTDLSGGFAGERDPNGTWTRGPAISGAIPIFNYGQGDRERLYAQYRQSLDRLNALEVAVVSQVRSAKDRLIVQREIVLSYQNELLPSQKDIVDQSERFYNVMALSVYKLLNAKKQEIQMQINYTIALKNYWISRVELDRSLGSVQ